MVRLDLPVQRLQAVEGLRVDTDGGIDGEIVDQGTGHGVISTIGSVENNLVERRAGNGEISIKTAHPPTVRGLKRSPGLWNLGLRLF